MLLDLRQQLCDATFFNCIVVSRHIAQESMHDKCVRSVVEVVKALMVFTLNALVGIQPV
ncbi:MAG: hypothetical protein NXI04_03210 [Planctomycetaceae bacterium]|nr:hypothetical protein [Planctomycetaceae bacterium]